MKEFIKNLLILLSTPIYLLAAFVMCVVLLSKRLGDTLMYHINKWINFMKDDYKKIYEVIKNGSKQR